MPSAAVRPRRRRLRSLVPLLAVLTLIAIGFWRLQDIRDWVNLETYDPPTPVVNLADDIGLTASARRIFYVNRPQLQDRSEFNSSCNSLGEQTIVLGCYHPGQGGIYVFKVTDPRLNGVDQVTAAHELLHAEYDRLGKKERDHIDTLLQSYYDTQLTDKRVKSVIDAYRKSEPNDVVNEMHSVFGTEIPNLPPELETYYARYFKDRSKITSYASSYQAEFTSRQDQVSNDDAKLKAMKSQIDADSTELKSREAQLTTLKQQMDSQRSSGDVTAYNNNVPTYNAQADAYNSLLQTTKSLISSYNDLVAQRNDLALQVTDLAHSIDSSFKPVKQ